MLTQCQNNKKNNLDKHGKAELFCRQQSGNFPSKYGSKKLFLGETELNLLKPQTLTGGFK